MGVAGSGLPQGDPDRRDHGCWPGVLGWHREWVSVQTTRELYERQVKDEAAELRSVPHEEREELDPDHQAKGLSWQRPERWRGG